MLGILIKITKILKVLILLSLILLFVLVNILKTHDCDLCSFDYNGKTLNTNEITIIYHDMCLNKSSLSNSSLYNSLQVLNQSNQHT